MPEKNKAYAALIYICLVWGTTYLAIHWMVEVYPAFLAAGARQLLAGVIILTMALATNRRVDLSTGHLARQATIGFLMIAMGNGLSSYAQKFIPSGVAAMVGATMPMWTVALNLAISKKEALNRTIVMGMLIGLVGVGLIFRADVASLTNRAYLGGIGVTLVATISWAVGSVLSRHWGKNVNAFFDAGVQVLTGGVVLLAAALVEIRGMPKGLPVDTRALWSFVYLVVFGSVLAYSFYQYALKRLPVGIVTIYAYINPLVAVLLGAAFGETLTWWTAASFVGIVSGVFLVNRGYRVEQAKPPSPTNA